MYRKILQCSFAALAMLCLFTLTVVSAQADDLSNPQPVINRSWGGIKTLYQPLTTTNATTQDSTAAARIGKPGVQAYGGSYADQQRWRNLSQAQRNSLIVQAAYNHLLARGGSFSTASAPTGYSCKGWVQAYVVPTASWSVASIPTNNGACRWYTGQYVQIVGYGPTGVTIEGAVPGNIVQTYWPGSGLHTFIIYSTNSAGAYWIDCNYSSNQDTRLRIHYVSYSTFRANSGGCYTVYQVIGG